MKLPEPCRNYRFHPSRKLEIDFGWPAYKIGLEIQGGVWRPGGGAHSRPGMIERDMEKHNLLLDLGWRVWQFTPQQVEKGTAIKHIDAVLTPLHLAAARAAAAARGEALPPSVAPGHVPPSSPQPTFGRYFDD